MASGYTATVLIAVTVGHLDIGSAKASVPER